MTSNELRQKYLDFFKAKGHSIIPSASLIPDNDPTVLFTTAGMHPLVPYLLGEKHPEGKRLTSFQKCIRTSDIEEVGDKTHHTFFEMLGNWSLGDYFKEKSIAMSWEFLTSPEWLNLDKNKIAVSVFAGDNDAPFDQEAFDIWKNKINISEKKIAKLPKKNNWWGLESGGPCGPDTEIFYWTGDANKIPDSFNDDNDLWVEIWNNVFMQYDKKDAGILEPLKQQNVDTGMGLERILAIVNNLADNYQTDLFKNIINKIEQLSNKKYGINEETNKAIRIIADHIKAAIFIIGDYKAITPSNTDRGYIVRRLIRRAIRFGKQLGINQTPWTNEIAKIVVNDYANIYFELQKNINFIISQLNDEEEKFSKTLENGLKQFENQKLKVKSISGQIAFDLYQTYGFPIEMTKELAKEDGIDVDEKGFWEYFKKHQELSRTASAGMFKGGLADASEETIKYHTTAHLMLAALKKVLGNHVAQKGSNITAERLRFDFLHNEKMSAEQLQQVESLVNQAIEQDLIVSCEEMTLDQARTIGATGVFDSKYGEKVKVYTISKGDNIFSKEICGGPHVNQVGILGKFKIKKEESSSAGVRRIKAVLE
ncbi:alanine--tRNA ligase [Patescibacteria group bacterium]|nr:alanine--tRNA ligase [Patescibacteria group bacterium]MBU0879458.1 alanine--tRNA ligase [Patescibacteria group bacterium]MBU1062577.1 alanine--tRNA ligase [Patescibacteria group bacterium]MBU2081240.1 alanine--tRNA ligase [Patescibacteria group bacterium]